MTEIKLQILKIKEKNNVVQKRPKMVLLGVEPMQTQR